MNTPWADRHPELVRWLQQADEELLDASTEAPPRPPPAPAPDYGFPIGPLLPFPLDCLDGPEEVMAYDQASRRDRMTGQISHWSRPRWTQPKRTWTTQARPYTAKEVQTLQQFFIMMHGMEGCFLVGDAVAGFAEPGIYVSQEEAGMYWIIPLTIVEVWR